MTVEETLQIVKDTSIGYIYKTRSEYMKASKFKPVYKNKKKEKILLLYKNKVSAKNIATEVDCSIQYVYRIIKNENDKANPRMLLMDKICSEQDEYYTPLYAIIPISQYINPNSIIWCPFDTEQSLYVRYFRSLGHTVISTHIHTGQDFFKTSPPQNCDYIISNPPYSQKERVFERLFELDIPFAMLVNTTGLFSAKSRFEILKDKIEMMVFQSRVQYFTNYNNITNLKNPPFSSGYICYNMLDKKLDFEELDRKLIDFSDIPV
jgi:hypothetical protein